MAFTANQVLVGATPIALNGGVSLPCAHILLQCDPTSAGSLLIGSAAVQVIVLPPGNAVLEIPITDASLVWIVSPATAIVNWLACPT